MERVIPRVLRAIAPYGLAVPDGAIRCAHSASAEASASRLIERLEIAPGLALVTGASGSGKSTLIRAVQKSLESRGDSVVRADQLRLPRGRPLAGLASRVPLGDWLGCLSRAGLADARLFATDAGVLSEGERARARLALAFARMSSAGQASNKPGGAWLICDEFCSVLDRDTAAGVASALRRWVTATGARVIVASAHADLDRLLGPDILVRTHPGADAEIVNGSGSARGPRVRIQRGEWNDYRGLARYHYRHSRPASPCLVLRAVVAGARGPRVAGVLVVSHPTLNGAWREMAWPGRYVCGVGDRAACARRLNREVRRISRVIVDPRDRGRGIARRLVRGYLDDPMSPATEALSAMGRLSPFGASAGMVEYALPPRAADDRLGDMLCAMGIEPWELMDLERCRRERAPRGVAWLGHELSVWARAVRASVPKPMRDSADAFSYAPLAAGRLCAPPVAYAHVS